MNYFTDLLRQNEKDIGAAYARAFDRMTITTKDSTMKSALDKFRDHYDLEYKLRYRSPKIVLVTGDQRHALESEIADEMKASYRPLARSGALYGAQLVTVPEGQLLDLRGRDLEPDVRFTVELDSVPDLPYGVRDATRVAGEYGIVARFELRGAAERHAKQLNKAA